MEHKTVRIVQKEDSVLRKIAEEVPVHLIKTPKIKGIVHDMKKALATQDDGVALAAPQIGVSLRIFIVSGKVFDMLGKKNEETTDTATKKQKDMVFINPVIIKLSKDKKEVEEGCLSVRYLYGKISRSKKARIRAYNEKSERVEIGASGLLAQIFQHETDHLEGKLFTDRATELRDLPPRA